MMYKSNIVTLVVAHDKKQARLAHSMPKKSQLAHRARVHGRHWYGVIGHRTELMIICTMLFDPNACADIDILLAIITPF